MDARSAFEWWRNQAVDLFKEAVLAEFYGNYLLETEDRNRYTFSPHETGDSVWLVRSRSSNQEYRVRQVEEARKFHPHQPIVPVLHPFHHCVEIPLHWLEDGQIRRIENELRQGARALAQRINQAFIDVLTAAVSGRNKILVQSSRLDEILAEVVDGLVEKGFRADRLL